LLWQYLFSRRKEWDLINLSNVPLSSSLARYIRENKDLKNVAHRSSQDEAVCLCFSDNEAYTKKVFHKRRIHEYRNHLKKNGAYEMLHLTRASDIEIYIEDFFAQHIERWRGTLSPSLFHDERNKQFYRHIVRVLPTGWITLSVLKWREQVLGFHFGLSYGKRFIWYKPAFNVAFARYSPGQVLLQEVMEHARTQGFEEFDFGVGKEAYKNRFGNIISRNNSFKVYPSRGMYLCYYIPRAFQWRWRQIFGK
jgi:CelD/BcsL family acetyltransferase involved in cellulose biosynthesis